MGQLTDYIAANPQGVLGDASVDIRTMECRPEDRVSPITNNPDLKFQPLTDEFWRTYEFTDGAEITIVGPVALNISASGGHRVLDQDGICHYLPAGWIHLTWRVKPGQPHFAF